MGCHKARDSLSDSRGPSGWNTMHSTTVILRTKGCTWWWKSGCTFCGYFNDVRDNVTVEDMLSQWSDAKKITNDFEGCKMVKVYTSGTFFEDRENDRMARDSTS